MEDGKYGALEESTGQWNGMVRELMDHVSGGVYCHGSHLGYWCVAVVMNIRFGR